ncbi:hypothetical protein [Pseudoduganella namucuonensis]|uniref:Uncharacterized protein n=1 Tax=Pseudoduganella namucuonensis TaxID=1035707 RepID=A0A1I7KYN6_9BURK|nr:hypothetical protein [Pseudoduganella namucuonensis]SFV02557.1 hypothetical protein SAMN05216552_102124 [Pseudoduganella namucuonensis]
MEKATKRIVDISLAWTGPLFVLGYILFWAVLGHNVPPPNMMAMTPDQLVSEYYGKYQNDIAIGMVGCCVVGLLYLPWSMLLASMLREEDGSLGVLSLMEAAGGLLTAWLLAFCPAIWAACALLATSIPAYMIKAMHVFTWVIYDCTFMITTIQLAGLGLYTILNRKQKIFPAWTGWCAIAVGIIFLPLVLMPFVSEGPFTVAGSWNFYIVFGTWLFAFFTPYSYYMLKETLGYNARAKQAFAPALG